MAVIATMGILLCNFAIGFYTDRQFGETTDIKTQNLHYRRFGLTMLYDRQLRLLWLRHQGHNFTTNYSVQRIQGGHLCQCKRLRESHWLMLKTRLELYSEAF